LLNIRSKHKVSALVNSEQPFIYTSGRYPGACLHTTAVIKLADHPDRQGALVYDLRVDPTEFLNLSAEKLADLWSLRGRDVPYFPVKALFYNRCPAIAPFNVLDTDSAQRLDLDKKKLTKHLQVLGTAGDFSDKLIRAVELMKKKMPVAAADPLRVDEQLYDGFLNDSDKTKTGVVRAADEQQLADLNLDFYDDRLKALLPLYKARNYPKSLTPEEQEKWEDFRRQKMLDGGKDSMIANFFNKLNEIAARPKLSDEQKYLLEELNLYGQSVTPVD